MSSMEVGVPAAPGVPDQPEGPARRELLMYTDEQLQVVTDHRRGHASSLVGHLLDASSSAARQSLMRGMLNAIGFQWLAYGTVELEHGEPVPTSFLTSYAHPLWTALYFRESFHEVDLRFAEASPSGLPLAWDIDDLIVRASAPDMTGRHRRFTQELRDHGLRSGVFMTLVSPARPQERTLISMSSGAPQRGWIVDSVLGQAVMLALCLHEYLTLHVRLSEETPETRPLLPVHREILRCLALGYSDKEIAYRLQLSAHTVDYHMRQLRRRFNVRNRVQLVKAAIGRAGSVE